ncbi:hypothetical protein CC99x_009805 [Candidatus Berkiella cookevillensis]|nr:hypothetical protein [Candidatus Berkiella cookevillensis]MCS5709199.1 hypothetical protein [Candidatus Berkiella cookevillensis]
MFTKIVKYTFLKIIPVSWTIISIIAFSLQQFGISPYYIDLKKKDYISPFLEVYSGEKIRLNLDLKKNISIKNIRDIQWTIETKNKKYYAQSLSPDFFVPDNGGLLNCFVHVITDDNQKFSSQLNFSVVETKPIVLKASENIPISYNAIDLPQQKLYLTDPKFEVLNSDNKWIDIESNNNGYYIKEGSELKIVNNKIFVREKGETSNIENYGIINNKNIMNLKNH